MTDTNATAASASTASKEDDGQNHEAVWWTALRWIANALLFPCKPVVFPFLPCRLCAHRVAAAASYVTGTFLCRPHERDRRVTLCLHEGGPAAPPLLLIDLPIGTRELSGAGRIALECDRRWAGAGPLLAAPRWAVHCGGRRVGFGGPRPATATEARALEAMTAVSAGAGRLWPPSAERGGGGGEWFAYLRGSFERVVGSADSETYHLVDPSGSLGLELSLFFYRV